MDGDTEVATTVADSPAHSAWVNNSESASGPASSGDTPAAPPSTDRTAAQPPAPAVPDAGSTPKATSIRAATDAYLERAKSAPAPAAEPAKDAAAAPAAPTTAKGAAAVASAAATAAGATPAEAAAAGQEAAEEFLEGQHNGQPFKIPMGVTIPIKVNGKIQHVPLKEAQKGLMLEADYSRSKNAVATDRRAVAAEQARLKAERDQLERDRKQVEDAQLDPEKFEQYQEHLRQLQTNPVYRETWERGRQGELDQAELSAFRGAEQESMATHAAEQLATTINTLANEYPGTDPALVRQQYADALMQGQADLTEASLRRIFAAEQQRASRYAGPLEARIQELTTRLDALTKAKAEEAAASTHNDNTRRAIDRDRLGRFTAPAGGSAPDVSGRELPKPFTSDELPSRKRDWINRRD